MANIYNITVLGGGAVGKSAITVQLVSGHFVNIYDPTIEDSYRTSISIDGEIISLNILDTAGQEEYAALRDQYMRTGQGYVIVYSIISLATFIEANSFREHLYRVLDKDYTEHIPIVLLGNKCDLDTERQVSKEEAEQLAREWNILFFETSAKNKINITESFIALVKDILEYEKNEKESKKVKEEDEKKDEKNEKEKLKHKRRRCEII